jgi:hypothetical protein
MRASAWLYPATNVLHLLAVALLVGTIVALDLRVLGLGRRLPLAALDAYLARFARVAIPLILVTGFCLFAADASHLVGSAALWVKLGLLALGLANALLFRRLWRGRLGDAAAPAGARAQAALSLLLWPSAAVAGRLIAYL